MRHIGQETGGQARHRGRRHLQALAWLSAVLSVTVASTLLVHVDARPTIGIVQANDTAKPYDTTLLPIEPEALQHSLTANSRDAVVLVQLLCRADEQNQNELAFKTMNQLRLEQPRNPVVLAAYCFAFDIGTYKPRKRSRAPWRTRAEYDAYYKIYEATLARARKLDPNLWLISAVEGHKLLYSPPFKSERYARGLVLLQKAVDLAPKVSYTHYWLADVYVLLAVRPAPPSQPYQKASAELEKALSLKPVLWDAATYLIQIHEIWLPDKAKTHRGAQAALASLPPGFKIGPKTRAWLAKYGVVAGA